MVEGTGTDDWCRWEAPAAPDRAAQNGATQDGTASEEAGSEEAGLRERERAPASGGTLVLRDGRADRARWARPAAVPDAATRERFLEVLAQTSNVRLAAQAVQLSVRPFYALRQRDGVFADAWQRALAEAADMVAGDLISAMREAAEAPLAKGADPKIVLAVLKIQAELARGAAGGGGSGSGGGGSGGAGSGVAGSGGLVRHVPLGVVQTEILRRLEALDPAGRGEAR